MSAVSPPRSCKLCLWRCFVPQRRLLLGLASLALLCEIRLCLAQPSVCQQLDPSPTLVQFVEPLPTLPVIDVSEGRQVTLGAFKISQKLHRDLPETDLYAFGISESTATYPGPTLLAKQHVPTLMRWENHIEDQKHMFTVDGSLNWANPPRGGVPMVVHLHGGEVESESDGHPDSWFTTLGDTGSGFTTQNYTYINEQPASTLWYHDHTLGITRLNVAAGLSGLYILTSEAERSLLPLGIPLVVQDRQFFANGSINFPNIGIVPDNLPNWCPEYFGDTIIVNGKVWPYLKVFPRPYRFRVLNACNARFLNLFLSDSLVPFYQIGTDGGFLPEAFRMINMTMAPAERLDVVIDFSGLSNGTMIVLNNSGSTPFPSGDIYQMPPGTYALLQFLVTDTDGSLDGITTFPIDLPSILEPQKPLSLNESVMTRTLSVVEYDDSKYLPLQFTLDNKTWEDPVQQKPVEGTTEVWELMNLRINAHPVHIHLVQFQVLNQQTFSNRNYESGLCSLDLPYGASNSCYTEAPRDPYDYHKGWKDTVITWPSVVTRVILRFTHRNGSAFGFDPSQGPGYVWHCHIVDHEDNVMMRPFVVQSSNDTARNERGIFPEIEHQPYGR